MTTDNCIIKIKDKYFLWSEYHKCPISDGYDLKNIKNFCTNHLYENDWIDGQISRVELTNCGNKFRTLDEIIKDNCSGDDDECLTMDEIYEKYVKKDSNIKINKKKRNENCPEHMQSFKKYL